MTNHPRSPHAKSCPEFRQTANAENDGAVIDTAFPCNCEPLTCSEVVERLAEEPYVDWDVLEQAADYLNHAGGGPMEDRLRLLRSQIDSWRERRVQELEMVIARAAFFVSFTKAALRERGDLEGLSKVHVWEQDAEKLLKSDEWREQIRKGAKHE